MNNEYITSLTTILAASLGCFFSIILRSISIRQKRKYVLILSIMTVGIIAVITFLFFYGKFQFNIPSLIKFNKFNESKLFPFHNQEFDDELFNNIYNVNIYISIIIFFIEYKILTNNKYKKRKIYLLLLVSCILVVSIMRIWTIYITCNILINMPMLLCYILQSIFYSFITFFELSIFCSFCYKDPYKDLTTDELNQLLIENTIKERKLKEEINTLLDKEE